MLRFGKPFECDRDDAKCFVCKNKIGKGEQLVWEFSERHRYHVKCADEVKEEQNAPIMVCLSDETISALGNVMGVKLPAKPGLFSGSSPAAGMTSEQTKQFNDLAERVRLLEQQMKEIRGDG